MLHTNLANAEKKIIEVKYIYSPSERDALRQALTERKLELDVGVPTLLAEIHDLVSAHRKRVCKPFGELGVYAEQLQPKNIYGFLSGRRMEDPRVQIIDAYLQILNERAKA